MCGRYYVDTENETIQAVLAAAGVRAKSGEIFPTDSAAVIVPGGEVQVMSWGFTSWDGKKPIINARSETVHEKPMFKRAFADSRCLIPASYYFEWEKFGKEKIRHTLSLPDSRIMYFAGICRREGDGSSTYVILTQAASSGIAYIHNRMPVILPTHTHDAWLHGGDGIALMREAVAVVAVDER